VPRALVLPGVGGGLTHRTLYGLAPALAAARLRVWRARTHRRAALAAPPLVRLAAVDLDAASTTSS